MTAGGQGEPDGLFDLRRLAVESGGAAHADVPVALGTVVLGGQQYAFDPPVAEAHLDVSSAGSGLGLRLRFGTDMAGPCQRCLDDARVHVDVDARDFQASGRDVGDDPDPDLDCEYLGGPTRQELDVAAWARDCVAEAVPMAILCRDDCAGMCPQCGANRNTTTCECVADTTDPRWAALGELAERLRDEPGAESSTRSTGPLARRAREALTSRVVREPVLSKEPHWQSPSARPHAPVATSGAPPTPWPPLASGGARAARLP